MSSELSDIHLILEKLNKIESNLEKVNDRINKIEKDLNDIKSNTNKMDKHINFVESMYDIVRSPMSDLLSYYYGEPKLKAIELTEHKINDKI